MDGDKDARPVYEGIQLVTGWKIFGTGTVLEKVGQTKRKKIAAADSFADVQKYASDPSVSLDNRLKMCVTKAFNIEETFIHLCRGSLKTEESRLIEEFGVEELKILFK